MSDQVDNLLLEHLRADMAKMSDHMATMSAEMRAMQLERIEKRLELAD